MDMKERIAARKAAKADGSLTPEKIPSPTAAATGSPVSTGRSFASRFRSVGMGTDVVDPDAPPKSVAPPSASADQSAVSTSVATNATETATEMREKGDFTSEDASRQDESTEIRATNATEAATEKAVPQPISASSATPKAPMSRAERFKANLPSMAGRRPAPAADEAQTEKPNRPDQEMPAPVEWLDELRPAGSAYSEEEWAAAEAANPGCIVMEMFKPEERALMAMPKDGIDPLLNRSLVIMEGVDSPWLANANASIEHHGDHGIFRYKVVRSQAEIRKCDWVNGSKLVIRDSGHEENKRPSRADRYRG